MFFLEQKLLQYRYSINSCYGLQIIGVKMRKS